MQFAGFGDGRDGAIPTSGIINTYAALTGSIVAATKTVPTALSVAAGDLVLLIVCQGAGAGQYELVVVDTPGVGSFTTRTPIVNGYTIGQAIRVPQYTGGIVTGMITASPWSRATGTGGVLAFAASGYVKIASGGSLDVSALGFAGGVGSVKTGVSATAGDAGEGILNGTLSQHPAANNNGGGGGGPFSSPGDGGSGGGGGGGYSNGNLGGNGQGTAGDVGIGNADPTAATVFLGGGGGGGHGESNNASGGTGGDGGKGGGITFAFVNYLEIEAGGTVNVSGEAGHNAFGAAPSEGAGGGGGGGGGDFVGRCRTLINNGSILHNGGAAGANIGGSSGIGGVGGQGNSYLSACDLQVSPLSPNAEYVEGGQDYCTIGGDIF